MKVETLKGRGWLAVGGDKHQVSYTLTAFQPLVERLRALKKLHLQGETGRVKQELHFRESYCRR